MAVVEAVKGLDLTFIVCVVFRLKLEMCTLRRKMQLRHTSPLFNKVCMQSIVWHWKKKTSTWSTNHNTNHFDAQHKMGMPWHSQIRTFRRNLLISLSQSTIHLLCSYIFIYAHKQYVITAPMSSWHPLEQYHFFAHSFPWWKWQYVLKEIPMTTVSWLIYILTPL